MKQTAAFFLISFLLISGIVACSGSSGDSGGGGGPGGDIDSGDEDTGCGLHVDVLIGDDPLALDFAFEGDSLTSLAASGGGSGFFVMSGGERLDLEGVAERSEDGCKTTLTYDLGDGRKASVTIAPADENSVEASFSVEGLKGSERLGADFKVDGEEGFYGLMERVVDGEQGNSWEPGITEGLNLRGQEVLLYVIPTVSIYSPFYVSSAGYGVYVESDWPGKYYFGVDDPANVRLLYEGPDLTIRIFPGPKPLDATGRYARTVGPTLMPPSWAFGPWRWRDDVYDLPDFYDGTPYGGPFNSMIVEDILMMEALGIPCSLYWVDRPWAVGDFGYDDLTWDEERLPEPLRMVQWLDGKDIRFMLWIAPWAMGGMADEAEEEGYSMEIEIPSGPLDAHLLDLSNPDAVEWWQDALIERIDEKVVGFKLDRCEEKNPDGIIFNGYYHDGRSLREGHNAYPYLYAKAVQGAFERAGVEDFVVMPRAGWKGSQKHAIFWGGDTAPNEWGLRSAIIALQRNAAMGFPIWGSDTCGYGFSPPETCARWLAFSAFSPLMEVGPTNNAAPWSRQPDETRAKVNENGYPYEPYYDEELVAVWIFYANIHDDLKEYSYAQALLAHNEGAPFVRPMILEYPDRPEYLDLFEQYLFGPDILVAPLWRSGQTSKDVHIPDGSWLDAWTGEAVESNTVVSIAAPIHKIPIFIRDCGSANLGDLNARWEEAQACAASVPDLAELAGDVE